MKALGGGELLLSVNERTRVRMGESSLKILARLLLSQDYVTDVRLHRGEAFRFDLDSWRGRPPEDYDPFKTLALRHAEMFGFGNEIIEKPWITGIPKKKVADVIIHRSPRYRNPLFPWRRVLAKYEGRIAIVGLPSEVYEFQQNFGWVPYHYTRDFYELAQVIRGSKLFIGNQSCPYAIAEGMKHRTIQETYLRSPDCLFPRKNAQFIVNDRVNLPDL